MKKLFVIAALLLAGFAASAQVNIGAGYIWNFWGTKDGSNKSGTLSMHGVYGGLSYNFDLYEGLGLAPGAYFNWASGVALDRNGKKQQETIAGITGRQGSSYMGLLFPLHLTYSMETGAGKAFVYLGPAFEYGLSLKMWEKFSGDNAKADIVGDNAFMKDDDTDVRPFNPFDVKLDVGFGYNWEWIQVNVGFDFGFLNRAKTSSNGNDGTIKTNANAVHAGVAFVF